MSTDTLRLEGKPGTGKVPPGKVTPLKGVKARPELTQQLVLKSAEPHTPKIPHWDHGFPFPKDVVYWDEDDGKLIADLRMTVKHHQMPKPNGRMWGCILPQSGTANTPVLKADIIQTEDGVRLTNVRYVLEIRFDIVSYVSEQWESHWGAGMEKLTGRYGLSPEERKYWAFEHEMDHFRAWSEYFRFMLKHIFSALNTLFEDDKAALTRINELNFNSSENFIVAAQRSHAFDEYRGAPLSGGKYSGFDFPDCDCYHWHQSGARLPKTYNEVEGLLLGIKRIDRQMFE